MTQEEKKLLLKDLCARLPYGTIIRIKSNNADEPFVDEVLNTFNLHVFYDSIEFIKPYLRPMSSITEEEYEQYRKFSYYGAAGYRNNDYKEMVATPSFEKMDFLNAHHFDYRGLIEKGLAIEAPEGMYG